MLAFHDRARVAAHARVDRMLGLLVDAEKELWCSRSESRKSGSDRSAAFTLARFSGGESKGARWSNGFSGTSHGVSRLSKMKQVAISLTQMVWRYSTATPSPQKWLCGA